MRWLVGCVQVAGCWQCVRVQLLAEAMGAVTKDAEMERWHKCEVAGCWSEVAGCQHFAEVLAGTG